MDNSKKSLVTRLSNLRGVLKENLLSLENYEVVFCFTDWSKVEWSVILNFSLGFLPVELSKRLTEVNVTAVGRPKYVYWKAMGFFPAPFESVAFSYSEYRYETADQLADLLFEYAKNFALKLGMDTDATFGWSHGSSVEHAAKRGLDEFMADADAARKSAEEKAGAKFEKYKERYGITDEMQAAVEDLIRAGLPSPSIREAILERFGKPITKNFVKKLRHGEI